MTSKEILFESLQSLLAGFINNPNNEEFIESLTTEEEKEEFVDLIDRANTVVDNILIAKANNQFPEDYDTITDILDILNSRFPNFTLDGVNEIRLIVLISKILLDLGLDLANETPLTIIENFRLVESADANLKEISFFFYENIIFDESFFVIDMSKLDFFREYINQENPSVLFLLTLLSKATTISGLNITKYILAKNESFSNTQEIISCILLHYVSRGLSFHSPKDYSRTTLNKWQGEIISNNKYQQFFTSLYILSEYNNSKDLLSKYLKAYHVLEDYMYKSQLVELEGLDAGRIFSIRDFKTMNERIVINELGALSDFLNKTINIEHSAGVEYGQYIFSKWSTFVQALTQPEISDIDKIMSKLNVKTKGQFEASKLNTKGVFLQILPSMIYKLRNSIVHNKSTEFHLTYNTLNEPLAKLINDFFIPILEDIIFGLTTKPSSKLVWFKSSSLKLWQE